MPEGGTLTLRTAILDAQNLELRVEDTGQGMAPEVVARALEPFYTTKAQGKGTGLGLSMVFGTVQAHGGSIELQSQIGKGTQVLIRLPFSAGSQLRPAWPARPRAEAGPVALRILLVDDDPLIRQTAPALLEALGHQVTVAGGGYEALGLVEYGSGWDLLVLDLNMPGMDGLETLDQLRRLRPDMPVLVATGHLDEASRERLAQVGRVAILTKPYSQNEIKDALEALVERSDPGSS
jgi:CheY-like chemotaxis protein